MKLKVLYIIIFCAAVVVLSVVMLSAFANVAVSADSSSISAKPNIIIDAGHGGEDGGASVDGVLEKDINLNISNILADTLRLSGYNVTEVRDTDIAVYDDSADTLRAKKVSDLHNRAELFNSSSDNIVVSIHQNKFENSAYSGTQIFYSTNNADSAILAEAIRSSVVSLIQPDNTRELKPATSDIYILDNAEVPAVIVECGFLSNDDERAKLLTSEYQQQMAYSIAMGVIEYIEATK